MPRLAFRAAGAALGLAPTAALAHPGHHEQPSVLESLSHVLSQPDHLIAVASFALLLFAGGGLRLLRARGAKRLAPR